MLSTTGRALPVVALFIVGTAVAYSANAAPPDDACALLTPAQVSAALGVPVGSGAYVTPTFKKTCTWSATTSGGGTVTLNLQSLDLFESGKKLASYSKSASTAPVSGLGDDAYYFVTGKLVSLIVKKGNAAFKVAVYAQIPIEKQEAAEKSLAVQAVSGL
jgi:hypothetical protein